MSLAHFNGFSVYEERSKIEEEVLKVYEFGSSVYGTRSQNSDEDFNIVVKSDEDLLYQVKTPYEDYTVFSENMFIGAIEAHKIGVLECIFLCKDDPYTKYFDLKLGRLRSEISAVSSNSWVKCRKKLQQGDVYIGLKSMFHSLRIITFGIQIAKHGKIIDYTEANKYLDRILEIGDNWDILKSEFRPVYNNLMTEFRKLAPLEEL